MADFSIGRIQNERFSLVLQSCFSHFFNHYMPWTAIASAQVPQTDYAISGGVHDGKAIVKAILAGASAVELCSVIYQRGNQVIADMTNEITQWMNRQGYKNISEFKSSMNALSTGASNPFERTQFMKYFSSKE